MRPRLGAGITCTGLHRPANFIERPSEILKQMLVIAGHPDNRHPLLFSSGICSCGADCVQRHPLFAARGRCGTESYGYIVIHDARRSPSPSGAVTMPSSASRNHATSAGEARPAAAAASLAGHSDASMEVRGPVIYARVVMWYFCPSCSLPACRGSSSVRCTGLHPAVMLLSGAMTATPALCALLLKAHPERRHKRLVSE